MFKKQQLLSKAMQIAFEVHNGQFDLSGQPYILHPIQVMNNLKSNDEELKSIAILHDVLEMADEKTIVFEKIKKITPNDAFLYSLDCLTIRENEPYDDYINRILTDSRACLVKLADIEHNTQITRLTKKLNIARIEKYYLSYRKIYDNISKNTI